MGLLEEFKVQNYSFQRNSMPQDCNCFSWNPKVEEKVDLRGRLKPFYGDTIVYALNSKDRDLLGSIQDQIYGSCEKLFSDRLKKSTFHLTLHDLLSNTSLNNIMNQMQINKTMAKDIICGLDEKRYQTIRMTSTYTFSFGAIGVVVGFEPSTEEDFIRIMELRKKFDEIVPLDKPFIPHVSVSYFRPGIRDAKMAKELKERLECVSKKRITIELELKNLKYLQFHDMNTFY